MTARLRLWAIWCVMALAASLGAVGLWTLLWPRPDPATLDRADAIMCLGTGLDENGQPGSMAQARVETCVDLFRHGVAPVVIFTGGLDEASGVTEGDAMARAALALGLPESALLVERESRSTLQNALFSLPLVPDAERIVLVTQAFHLPRSWASYRWAGARGVALYPAGRIMRQGGVATASMLVRESLAIWFNLARASAFTLGGIAGISERTRIAWLY